MRVPSRAQNRGPRQVYGSLERETSWLRTVPTGCMNWGCWSWVECCKVQKSRQALCYAADIRRAVAYRAKAQQVLPYCAQVLYVINQTNTCAKHTGPPPSVLLFWAKRQVVVSRPPCVALLHCSESPSSMLCACKVRSQGPFSIVCSHRPQASFQEQIGVQKVPFVRESSDGPK